MTERELEITKDLKRADRGRRFLIAAAIVVSAIAVFGLAAAVTGFFLNRSEVTNVHNDVTKIEHSACTISYEHPGDDAAATECALIRAHLLKTEPIENSCISLQRATGKKGRNCARFYVDVDRAGAPEPPTSGGSPPQPRGSSPSEPSSSAPPGHQQAHHTHHAPTSTGSPAGHHHGAGGNPPDQPSSSPPSPSPAAGQPDGNEGTSSGTTATTGPTSPTESPTSSGPTVPDPLLEATADATEETAENVNGVVCSATGALHLNC